MSGIGGEPFHLNAIFAPHTKAPNTFLLQVHDIQSASPIYIGQKARIVILDADP